VPLTLPVLNSRGKRGAGKASGAQNGLFQQTASVRHQKPITHIGLSYDYQRDAQAAKADFIEISNFGVWQFFRFIVAMAKSSQSHERDPRNVAKQRRFSAGSATFGGCHTASG
jgi:hypothetical protein